MSLLYFRNRFNSLLYILNNTVNNRIVEVKAIILKCTHESKKKIPFPMIITLMNYF